MEDNHSHKWSIHNQTEQSEFEKSDKTTTVRFLYTPIDKNSRLGLNKYYSAQLLNCKQISFFLDIGVKELKEKLQEFKIFPALYRRRSALYSVKDIIKLAKRLKKDFLIPIGFFNTPFYLYVGPELKQVARIWHEHKTKRYSSLFELIMEEGIPVQSIIISPSQIKYLERSFLTTAGKLYRRYNKAAKKLHMPLKHIYLCTMPGKREYANKLVEKYNKQFPSFLISIDLDHLVHLRERFAQINKDK